VLPLDVALSCRLRRHFNRQLRKFRRLWKRWFERQWRLGREWRLGRRIRWKQWRRFGKRRKWIERACN
jgi:hypothetical protein